MNMQQDVNQLQYCADLLLATLPAVMQTLRAQVRIDDGAKMTIPQIQIMSFIERNPGCMLGAAAAHVGVGLSTASATVARLAKQGMLKIDIPPENRRCAAISLTKKGEAIVLAARGRARAFIVTQLAGLNDAEQQTLGSALQSLKQVFLAMPAPQAAADSTDALDSAEPDEPHEQE